MKKLYKNKYTKKQLSIIIASWLGDGYITKYIPKRKNAYLEISHGERQFGYLQWKMDLFKQFGFFVNGPYQVKRTVRVINVIDKNLFNTLRGTFYNQGKRKLKLKWLKKLDALGLAIWFMDDGSLTKRGNSYYSSLHTNSFRKKDVEKIIKFFSKYWKVNGKLRVVKGKNRNETYFITFNRLETNKLFDIIEPYIYKDLLYKVDVDRRSDPMCGSMTKSELQK
jgi:hypothetical protein